MEPTTDLIRRLYSSGEFSSILRATGFPNGAPENLEPSARVILARILAENGHCDEAWTLASLDGVPSVTPTIRSGAELVFGIVARRRGDFTAAANHFQASIRLARESQDAEQIAWSNLALFRLLIDGHPSEEISARLSEVRRVVTQAGNPHITAYLHECVATLEGHTGRVDEALRHCDIVDALLQIAPNEWLRRTALLNRACVSYFKGDFDSAYRLFVRARKLARETGQGAAIADNDLGYIDRLRGKWDKAQRWYEGVLTARDASALVVAAACDGLARISLAQDRIDECERTLEHMEHRIGGDPRLRLTYNVRWTDVTRARALMRRRRFDQVLKVVAGAKQTAMDVGDRPLLSTLCLIAAEAYVAINQDKSAAVELMAAANSGGVAFPEIQGQYFLGAALTIDEHDGLSSQLQARAFRLWNTRGIVSIPMEMTRRGDNSLEKSPAGQSPAEIVDSIAAAFDLASSPALLGAELVNAIEGLGCADSARVTEGRGKTPPAGDETTTMLSLGTEKGAEYRLTCGVPSRPRDAVLLADVLRIGRAAVELERYRQEERTRAALWPADPIETEAGALFLAEEMQTLLATARRVAPTTVPILVTGETGTGKEVLARLIHAYSTRAKATFLPFNCSATPKDMLDSQLFGHRRGAFTGATDSFPGVIRASAGGTLLLDEIGELTPDVQPKLLRFLESGEVHPLGETHPGKVDVRIIAATNADLDALVSAGRFREDLFYRLNIVRLHLPPLRERRVEIPALANHYLRRHARENGKGDLRLAEETMEYLVLFRWPGNVRQLANEMRRLAALAESGAVLMPEHLSAEIFASRKTVPASERTLEPTELVVRLDQPLAAAVQHVERAMIVYAMQKCSGGMEDTAALLGLSRKGLYLKRLRYAIETPGEDAAAVA